MGVLDNLKKVRGKEKKRRGRGTSSGVGGTSGRGHKGERSRSGKKISPWFEGGQTPLYRRLPKRGFRNPSSVEYQILNVGDLNKLEDGTVVNKVLLYEKGFVKRNKAIKILGNGELTKKLTIEDIKVSKSAKDKVEARGGSVVVIEKKLEEAKPEEIEEIKGSENNIKKEETDKEGEIKEEDARVEEKEEVIMEEKVEEEVEEEVEKDSGEE